MEQKLEFNSEFSNVKYLSLDNIVLLTWKKFCCGQDYRQPTLFALELLKKHKDSNFIIDARRGFEDDLDDVKWGFNFLLPALAETDCKFTAFIINEVSEIEEEIDMWTKEFGKYFAVTKSTNYDNALQSIGQYLLFNVSYEVSDGERANFYQALLDNDIAKKSREEPGNIKYDYYFPPNDENSVFLVEMWTNANAQMIHTKLEHFKKLQEIKGKFVKDVKIEKYHIQKI